MSEIRANTVSNAAGTGPVTLTGQYGVKAWCNMNQAVTPQSIFESFNISSATDTGVAQTTLTFTNSWNSSRYAVASMIEDGGGFNDVRVCNSDNTQPRNETSFGFYCLDGASALNDAEVVSHIFVGDLA